MAKWKCYTKQFRDPWIRTLGSTENLQISDGTIPGLILRYLADSGHISFFLLCRTHIKPRCIFIGRYGDLSVKDIKDKALELRRQIALGHDPVQARIDEMEQKRKTTGELFGTLFKEYMEKYAKLYKKQRTQDANWSQYRLYIEPLFADMHIGLIEEKHVIDAYVGWAKKTSFSTANKALSLLSNFWDWCENYKYVERRTNPCKYVRKGSNEKYKPTILDLEGYKKLFHWLDVGIANGSINHPRLFRAVKLIALTGCRCSEITDLEIDEVSLSEKKIHLKDSKTGARDVKLADAAVKELKLALEETKELGSKYVFPGLKDKDKPIDNVRKAFEWTLKKAELPHMRIHDLRHSFITMGANLGENMNALKDAAGHSRLATTEHYTHYAAEQTFVAVNHITEAICE
jgi:integrase